jgi:hypothetical protein
MVRSLAKWSLATIHAVFVEATRHDHWINLRGAERRQWLRAEDDALSDLAALVAACDPSAPRVPEGAVDDADLDVIREELREQLGAALAVLSDEDANAVAKRTRVFPLAGARLDLKALDAWMEALFGSLAYSDGDGDERHVPEVGDALLEVVEAGRAARRPTPAVPDWARARARRSDAVEVLRYDAGRAFASGQWLSHEKFGEGVVLEANERIHVLFESGPRRLVHTRPAPT